MRIVLDTNIIVSGVLSTTGASRALLDAARHAGLELVISPILLAELEEVLGRVMSEGAAAEIRSAIEELASLVAPTEVPAVVRDADDDHVLAAVVAGGPTHIVTRDKHLLSLAIYAGITILEPAVALSVIRADRDEA